jgi:hypothetical protein
VVGRPSRSKSWLEDFPRRARLEAEARRAFPTLQWRRQQRRQGPFDIYDVDLEIPGYERRHVTVEFERKYWWSPSVFADGPTGHEASPHRYGGRRLCLWYSGDPVDRRWEPDDGLLVLFGMIAEHLFKEAWWREHGEWLGEEYPHDELTKDDWTPGSRLP